MAGPYTPGAGDMPAPGPRDPDPAVLAAADQQAAALRDLVQLVRDHQDAHECLSSLPCPGEWAFEQLLTLGCHHRLGLLSIALVELAALGYGLPAAADGYELTDAARQALDDGAPGNG